MDVKLWKSFADLALLKACWISYITSRVMSILSTPKIRRLLVGRDRSNEMVKY